MVADPLRKVVLTVIAGNLVGGSVAVAGVYWVIYRRKPTGPHPKEPPHGPA